MMGVRTGQFDGSLGQLRNYAFYFAFSKISKWWYTFWFHESIYCHRTHLQNIIAYLNIKSLSVESILLSLSSRSWCSVSAGELSTSCSGYFPGHSCFHMSYPPVGSSISLALSLSPSQCLFIFSATSAGERVLLTALVSHLWAHFLHCFVPSFSKSLHTPRWGAAVANVGRHHQC